MVLEDLKDEIDETANRVKDDIPEKVKKIRNDVIEEVTGKKLVSKCGGHSYVQKSTVPQIEPYYLFQCCSVGFN